MAYPRQFHHLHQTLAKLFWKMPESKYSRFHTSYKALSHSSINYFLLFSHSVMSNSLQPNGLQHSRLPCPSPSPKICPSSCPLHQWCHSVISSSDALFSSALNLSQHQGLFQWVRFFTSDKQNTGASASVSVLPRNIEDWFPSRLTGLIFFGEGKVHYLKCLWLFST